MNNDLELYKKYKFLIYKVIKDIKCQFRNDDEWQEYYDAGELGLIQAINTYNKELNPTSSYFYTCIKNNILILFKSKTSDKRKINYLMKESLEEEIIDGKLIKDIIVDENVDIEKYIIKKEEYELLYKAIDKLKPTYKKIICEYYGINQEPKTLEYLSKIYKISKQAISVKKENALKELRKIYKKKRWDKIE